MGYLRIHQIDPDDLRKIKNSIIFKSVMVNLVLLLAVEVAKVVLKNIL